MHDLVRTAVAVFAGILLWFLGVFVGTILATTLFVTGGIAAGNDFTARLPLTFLAATLVVSLLAAAGGGWLAARLDDAGRWRAVVALAIAVGILSVANMRAPSSPMGTLTWYPWVVALLGVLGVVLGGWARRSAVDFTSTRETPAKV